MPPTTQVVRGGQLGLEPGPSGRLRASDRQAVLEPGRGSSSQGGLGVPSPRTVTPTPPPLAAGGGVGRTLEASRAGSLRVCTYMSVSVCHGVSCMYPGVRGCHCAYGVVC